MKKIPKIIPCVCTTHTPCSVVSSEYGMPVMIPYGDGNQTWFGIKCPMCGRGGFKTMSYPSAYKAIVAWNELQMQLYSYCDRPVEYDSEYDETSEYNDFKHNRWASDLTVGYAQGEFEDSCNHDLC